MIYTPPNLKTGLKSALSFDPATSDYVGVPYATSLAVTSTMAVGGWVYVADHGAGYSNVIGNRNASGSFGWMLYISSTGTVRPHIRQSNGTVIKLDSANPIPLNTWTFVLQLADGTNLRLFIDNEEDANSGVAYDGTIRSLSQSIQIGGGLYETESINGTVSNMRVHNRALTAGEIKLLSIGMPISTYGLVGFWPLTYGSGTTAYDRSGNGNHGTLNGSPTWTTDTPW